MRELIYLSLGSNLGNRVYHLEEAIRQIEKQVGSMEKISGKYETESWGFSTKNKFCNCCVSAYTLHDPLLLLEKVLQIEKDMGRIRGSTSKPGVKYADRIIDIDVLSYGDMSMNHPRLVLPHPSLADRRFVLVPLQEIAPQFRHPVNKLSIAELLRRCEDKGKVSLLE